MGTSYKLYPRQIKCYIFGSWQSLHEVHACLTGILKMLGRFDSILFFAHTEIDQILTGNVPGGIVILSHLYYAQNTGLFSTRLRMNR